MRNIKLLQHGHYSREPLLKMIAKYKNVVSKEHIISVFDDVYVRLHIYLVLTVLWFISLVSG